MYLLLDFVAKHGQNLARATIILLVILVTLSIASSALFAVDMVTRRSAVVAPAVADPTPRAQRDRGPAVSIAEFNLFGTAAPAAVAGSPVEAPETKLNLTLEGVFTATNAPESSAIIANARQPGELFRVGDKLPGNVTLTAVFADHVILQRGARYETLRFAEDSVPEVGFASPEEGDLPQGEIMVPEEAAPPDDSAAQADNASADDDDDQPVRRVRRVAPRSNSDATAGQATQGGQKSLNEMVDFYRERLTTDPDSLLADLGVEPVDSGGTNGYRLGTQFSAQQLQQAGLMPGDIVLSLNGQPVNAVLQDQALIDAAMAAGRVRVEIQRQDRRFFVTVPVR